MNGARIERELLCGLTDEEVQSRGRLLSETVTTIDEINEARTAAAKQFKERVTGLVELQRRLSKAIRERAEMRMVVCAVQFHRPSEGMKRIVRTDTGEVLCEEPMTDGEKQLHLFAAQSEFEKFMQGQGIAPLPAEPTEDPEPPAASDGAPESDD